MHEMQTVSAPLAIQTLPPLRSHNSNDFCGGEVLIHADCKGQLISMVACFEAFCYKKDEGICDWMTGQGYLFIATADILASVLYTKVGDSSLRTLIPWALRGYQPAKA